MYLKSGLLFLATVTGINFVNADFMVYTEPPIPTSAIPSFANPSDVCRPPPFPASFSLQFLSTDYLQASSWTFSVFFNANIAYRSFTNSLGPPYKSSSSSAASEIAAFVSTATNYSIPAAVTESGTTTLYGAPVWYTALPSRARAFKEQQVEDQFSIVRRVIAARQTTSSSTGGASVPTAIPFLGKEFGVMAAAAAAAFL